MNAPTHNPMAERAVLAALMRDPDHSKIIRLGITSDLFTQDVTRDSFIAIVALLSDGIRPDAAMLRSGLSDAGLIEIETSLTEHASAANLPGWIKLLKDAKRERETQSARARLARAAENDAPPHELSAIVESVRLSSEPGTDFGKQRFLDVADLCALPPLELWLLKGYLFLDSVSVIFGSPGCGKSFLAIDIACHVATGRPWRGRAVKPGKVLYIAGEGRNGLAKRFKAWFDRYGETPRNIQLCLSPIALTDMSSIQDLINGIHSMPYPPVLIVVDTINRNFGPGDENATADMTSAVRGLDSVRTATGAAILGVHHCGHGEKNRGRGSSVLLGSVDMEYAAEIFDRTIRFYCTKAKDSDFPPPLAWALEKQSLPWADDEGAPLDSAVLSPSDLPDLPDLHDLPAHGRTTSAQRIAMTALKAALVDHGTEDQGLVSVSEDQWRNAAYKAGISGCTATQNAMRMAFNRARDSLVASKKVTCFDGRYWIQINRTEPHRTAQSADTCNLGMPNQTAQNRTHPLKGCADVRLCGTPNIEHGKPKGNGGDPDGNGGDPAPDPLARRIQELIAEGWAPSNARAKALTEAREAAP